MTGRHNGSVACNPPETYSGRWKGTAIADGCGIHQVFGTRSESMTQCTFGVHLISQSRLISILTALMLMTIMTAEQSLPVPLFSNPSQSKKLPSPGSDFFVKVSHFIDHRKTHPTAHNTDNASGISICVASTRRCRCTTTQKSCSARCSVICKSCSALNDSKSCW